MVKIIRNLCIAVATLFGVLTLFAGAFVLLGTNPGYVVFLPLLVYNTAMGIVYIVTGIIAYHNIKQSMYLASVIFMLNLIVLATIFFLYSKGNAIAIDSLRAMSLRTVVWFVLFAGFFGVDRSSKHFMSNV